MFHSLSRKGICQRCLASYSCSSVFILFALCRGRFYGRLIFTITKPHFGATDRELIIYWFTSRQNIRAMLTSLQSTIWALVLVECFWVVWLFVPVAVTIPWMLCFCPLTLFTILDIVLSGLVDFLEMV